jgi:hypothetical protein
VGGILAVRQRKRAINLIALFRSLRFAFGSGRDEGVVEAPVEMKEWWRLRSR